MFGFKKSPKNFTEKESKGIKASFSLREKSSKLFENINKKFHSAQEEFFLIKSKLENLRETNYNLGLKHLENGNLSDAIFRFRFIKKFWPELYDAYYQLAYCFVLNEEFTKAKDVLNELIEKDPTFDTKAHDLLEHIEEILQQKEELQ